MDISQFLEEYPLYQKFDIEINAKYSSDTQRNSLETRLGRPIHTLCQICKTERTFNDTDLSRTVWETTDWVTHDNGGGHTRTVTFTHYLVFQCTYCNKFQRTYTVLSNVVDRYLQKVGQYPAWRTPITKDTAKALGTDKELFQKGLVCESEGYGIGAYSYYRRIVEAQIDTLLNEIAEFLSGSARTEYDMVLTRIRDETIAAKKIELAKELLPSSLRPDGLNPLDALYVALSKGIHQLSDEDCLELASAIRSSLVYLIKRTAESKRESNDYLTNVRKILDRNRGKS